MANISRSKRKTILPNFQAFADTLRQFSAQIDDQKKINFLTGETKARFASYAIAFAASLFALL